MSTLRTTTLKHSGSSTLDNLVFSNAGESRFCPNSSFGRAALYVDGQTNRVGVNNETPGVALDVDGAVNATGNATLGGTLNLSGDFSVGTNPSLFVDTSNTTGRVGIGTSTPTNMLEVINSVNTGNTYIHVQNTGAGNAGVKMQNNAGEWTVVANDRLRIIDDDNAQESVSILSNGNVGIGITSPDSKLEINAASPGALFDALSLHNETTNTAGTATRFKMPVWNGAGGFSITSYGNASDSYDAVISTAQGSASLRFQSSNGQEAMRLDSSQRLLINKVSSTVVSSNQSQIQLQGDSQSTGRMSIIRTSVDAGGAGIHLCKSRGLTDSTSYNLPDAEDQVGILVANAGNDSPSISKQVASIQFKIDSTPTVNNVPGRLGLYTTTRTGSSPSEKLRIDSQGAITQSCYAPNASLTTVLYSGSVTDNAQNGNATFDVTFTLPDNSNYFICEIIGYHPNYTAANEYYRFVATKRTTNNTHIVSIIDDLTSTGSTSVTDTTVTFTGRRPRSSTGTSVNSIIQVIYRGIQTPTDVTIANS